MNCPICNSQKIVEGQIRMTGESSGVMTYQPDELRAAFMLQKSVDLVFESFSACVSCGHLWSRINPDELAALLEKRGTDEVRNRILNS